MNCISLDQKRKKKSHNIIQGYKRIVKKDIGKYTDTFKTLTGKTIFIINEKKIFWNIAPQQEYVKKYMIKIFKKFRVLDIVQKSKITD